MIRRNDVFARLLKHCEPLAAVSCAVAHPCDPDSLMGALEAARLDLIMPVLVGPAARIRALARGLGQDISNYGLSTPSTAMRRPRLRCRSPAAVKSKR